MNFHDLVGFNVVSSLRHVQYTLSYIVEGGVGNEMDAHQGEELLGEATINSKDKFRNSPLLAQTGGRRGKCLR